MVNELAAARFGRATHSDQLGPIEVLNGALADTDVTQADHVMILYYKVGDEGTYTSGWLQGGNLPAISQLGLLARTITRMQEGV